MSKILGFLVMSLCLMVASLSFTQNQMDLPFGAEYQKCVKKVQTVEEANTCLDDAGILWQKKTNKVLTDAKTTCDGNEVCLEYLNDIRTNWNTFKDNTEGYTSSALGQSQIGFTQTLTNTAFLSKQYFEFVSYMVKAVISHNN